ncbi:hypothetical protein HK099_003535 [Clydaea vesicula]|uniref:BTB domain-containing protein n=1 Tax=Clydaea vesicula TaxID=447962 RepID=A0AAD5U1J7_9FUNG|nr:hypothetical protein HK099_003535 [Clydaea vesicula]
MVLYFQIDKISTSQYNDVTFVVGAQKKEIKGLKGLLASQSKVFEKLLFTNSSTSCSNYIELPKMLEAPFETLIRFFNSGIIDEKLFKQNQKFCVQCSCVARYYEAWLLLKTSNEFFIKNLSNENFVESLLLTKEYQFEDLRKIVLKFSAGALSSVALITSPFDIVQEVFYSVKDCAFGQAMFFSLLLWVSNNSYTPNQLTALLSLINFEDFTSSELMQLEKLGSVGSECLSNVCKERVLKGAPVVSQQYAYNLNWEDTSETIVYSANEDEHTILSHQSVSSGVLTWEIDIIEVCGYFGIGISNALDTIRKTWAGDYNFGYLYCSKGKLHNNGKSVAGKMPTFKNGDTLRFELNLNMHQLRIMKMNYENEEYIVAFSELPKASYSPAVSLKTPGSATIRFISHLLPLENTFENHNELSISNLQSLILDVSAAAPHRRTATKTWHQSGAVFLFLLLSFATAQIPCVDIPGVTTCFQLPTFPPASTDVLSTTVISTSELPPTTSLPPTTTSVAPPPTSPPPVISTSEVVETSTSQPPTTSQASTSLKSTPTVGTTSSKTPTATADSIQNTSVISPNTLRIIIIVAAIVGFVLLCAIGVCIYNSCKRGKEEDSIPTYAKPSNYVYATKPLDDTTPLQTIPVTVSGASGYGLQNSNTASAPSMKSQSPPVDSYGYNSNYPAQGPTYNTQNIGNNANFDPYYNYSYQGYPDNGNGYAMANGGYDPNAVYDANGYDANYDPNYNQQYQNYDPNYDTNCNQLPYDGDVSQLQPQDYQQNNRDITSNIAADSTNFTKANENSINNPHNENSPPVNFQNAT